MKSNKNIEQIIVKSPGRINLIGEHIDYNGGNVLPGSIKHKLTLKFYKTNNNQCTISSEGYGSFKFDIKQPLKISSNQWENYILGVVDGLNKKALNELNGFDCIISGDLPIGAGIASSAALECGVAKGLNELFDLNINDEDLIDISCKAEHNFVNNKCGVMDQFTVIKGQEKKLLLLNCATLEHKLLSVNFKNYKIVLLNSNVDHNLATSEYNIRREECEQALKIIQDQYPEYNFLADVPEAVIKSLKEKFPKKLFQRAIYVSQENARTLKAASLLEEDKIVDFGSLMYQSHKGLSEKYQVSVPELDFLVDLTKGLPQVIGSRLMGGGFGGSTINLVDETFVKEFINIASVEFKNKFNINLTPLVVDISNGVEVINSGLNGYAKHNSFEDVNIPGN